MEYDHIMTPDEIDDLFREAVKQLAGKTDIRVTMIQTERKRLSDDRVCCIITSAIWNDSPQKACLSVNSYIINNKREQHFGETKSITSFSILSRCYMAIDTEGRHGYRI